MISSMVLMALASLSAGAAVDMPRGVLDASTPSPSCTLPTMLLTVCTPFLV